MLLIEGPPPTNLRPPPGYHKVHLLVLTNWYMQLLSPTDISSLPKPSLSFTLEK